jgi:hypothetical protein
MGAAMGVGGVVGDASGGWLVAHAGPPVALVVAAAAACAGGLVTRDRREVPAAGEMWEPARVDG